MKLGILLIVLAVAGCAAKPDGFSVIMPPGASVAHMNIERNVFGQYTVHDSAFYNGAELELP